MLNKLILLSNFSNYYLNEPQEIYNNLYNKRIGFSDQILIDNCNYFNFSTFGTSLIDIITRATLQLLISNSMFAFCNSNVNGGVIFFQCSLGNIVFNKICVSNCKVNNNFQGHFCFNDVGSSRLNYFDFVSIIKCSPDGNIGSSTIYLLKGHQKIEYSNFSNNYAQMYSSIYSESFNSINLLMNTFFNNFVVNSICIYFSGSNSKNISFINFILNNSPSNACIYLLGSLYYFYDSIFLNNFNTLFYSQFSSNYIIRGWLSHYGTLFSNTILQTQSVTNTFLITSIYNFTHYSSFYCNSELIYNCEILPTPSPPRTIPPNCLTIEILKKFDIYPIFTLIHFYLIN